MAISFTHQLIGFLLDSGSCLAPSLSIYNIYIEIGAICKKKIPLLNIFFLSFICMSVKKINHLPS